MNNDESEVLEGEVLDASSINKLTVTKFVVSTIVGMGAGKIVGGIIKNNVPVVKMRDKVTVAAAAFVIGSMLAQATKKYTDEQIDIIADSWQSGVDAVREFQNNM